MNLLSAEEISLRYGTRTLFEGISLGMAQGQKAALIGVNGSGKTSLLRILAGIEPPDTGRISKRRGTRIGFLPQEPDLPGELTVREVIFRTDVPALQLLREYEKLLALPSPSAEQTQRIAQLSQEIDARRAWDAERRISTILSKLEVNDLDQRIDTMSGGQQKRVALAQVLVEEPEILILDEPTNQLDLATIEWLESVLSTSKQSLILVTHDRYFLDSVTTEILELDGGSLYQYDGSYADFLEKKAEREFLEDTARERAASLFKHELEWLRRSPKARTTKSKARISSAEDLGEAARNYRDTRQVRLAIQNRRIGGKVMEIKNLRKSFGDLNIVDNFSYTFNRRDRVGIAGPNGVGKTTFINMLLGLEPFDSGKIRLGETMHVGYYRQQTPNFKPEQRVIEVVREVAEEVSYGVNNEKIPVANLLEYFLFPHSTHTKRIETLSGGEKRRLQLLRVLIQNPNLLVLDEPTNDLDLVTLRRLEEFLEHDYEGCLVIVSHDRYFMDRLIDHLWVFEGEGQIRDYPGSYSQYRAEVEQRQPRANPTPSPTEEVPSKPAPRKKTKLSYNEQREYEALETEIAQLSERRDELRNLLGSGETDYKKLTEWTEELESVKSALDAKEERWLELEMSLE